MLQVDSLTTERWRKTYHLIGLFLNTNSGNTRCLHSSINWDLPPLLHYPLAVRAQSPNNQTTGEFPTSSVIKAKWLLPPLLEQNKQGWKEVRSGAPRGSTYRGKAFLVAKNLLASAGDRRDVGMIPGSGSSPGEGLGYSLQYSCLESPMDRGAWGATVQRVTKSRTRLNRISTQACMHTEETIALNVEMHYFL